MAARQDSADSDMGGLALLMARVQGEDQGALAAMFDATHRRVHGNAMRFLGDEGLADDVVVETFAKVWRLAERFDGTRGSVLNWLMTLSTRIAIDAVRRRGVRSTLRGASDEPLRDAADAAPGPSQASAEAESRCRIRRAVAELPDRQRIVIEAAFFGGLSHKEVAESIGEALGTIKSRIRAGLIALRDALEPGEVGLS